MPQINRTPEEWKKLLDNGVISEDTYNKAASDVDYSAPAPGVSYDEPAPELMKDGMNQGSGASGSWEEPAPVSKEELATPANMQQANAPMDGMQLPDPYESTQNAYDLQSLGIMQQAQAGREQAAKEAGYLDQLAKEQERTALANQAEYERRQKEVADKMQALNDSINEINSKNISREETQKNYWANKTTGQKIMAGIGLFLGAVGAIKTGHNAAAKVINDAIDKDVEDQYKNLENKKAGLTSQKTLLSQMLDMHKDMYVAKEAARAAGRQAAMTKLEGIAARYKGQEVGAKAVQLVGALQARQAEDMAKIQQYQMQKAAYSNPSANQAMMDDKTRERYVPGYGFAASSEEGKKIREGLAAKNSLVKTLNEMIALRQKHGTEFLDRSAVAHGKALAADAQLQIKTLAGLGSMSKGDFEFVERIVPSDPLEVGVSVESKLKAAIDRAEKGFAEKLKSQGMQPLQDKLGIRDANLYKK